MQTIFKSFPKENFTILPNALLRDRRLSFKARGILAMILSNIDEWVVHRKWIKTWGTEGREAIASAMHELESFGYTTYEERRSPDGRVTAGVWVFYDHSVPEDKRTQKSFGPDDQQPPYGLPYGGMPCEGLPSPKKDYREEESSKEETRNPSPEPKTAETLEPESLDEMAEQVYQAYPRKAARPAALKAIRIKLKAFGLPKLLSSAQAMAEAWVGKDLTFCPHPATFFNRERFNDDHLPLPHEDFKNKRNGSSVPPSSPRATSSGGNWGDPFVAQPNTKKDGWNNDDHKKTYYGPSPKLPSLPR